MDSGYSPIARPAIPLTRKWTFTDRRREAAGRAHVALAPARSEGQTATVPGARVCGSCWVNQHMGGTGLRLMYDFALVPRSALIPDSRSHSDRLPNGQVPAGPAGVHPLQNARMGGYHAFVAAKLVVYLGIPDQLGLTAADDAKKLQFQMNVFWLRAARIVPKGGPRHDT